MGYIRAFDESSAVDEAGATAQTRREYIPVGSASSIPAVEGLRNGAGSILKAWSHTQNSLPFNPLVMPESPQGFSGIHLKNGWSELGYN